MSALLAHKKQGATQIFVGLELAGARNFKTCLAILEVHSTNTKTKNSNHKVFLRDLLENKDFGKYLETDSPLTEHFPNDELLLSTLSKIIKDKKCTLATNISFELPPCIPCKIKNCPSVEKCRNSSVVWMKKNTSSNTIITPYTQSPTEIWLKNILQEEKLPLIPDESLGGTKAPLTARLHFLKKRLAPFNLPLYEVHPKLATAQLIRILGIEDIHILQIRNLEKGYHSRTLFLDKLIQKYGLFVYASDLKRLTQSLPLFDAFICAWIAYLHSISQTKKIPKALQAISHTTALFPK